MLYFCLIINLIWLIYVTDKTPNWREWRRQMAETEATGPMTSTLSQCQHQHHRYILLSSRIKCWWSALTNHWWVQQFQCRWFSPTSLTSSWLASRSGAVDMCSGWSPLSLQVTYCNTDLRTVYKRLFMKFSFRNEKRLLFMCPIAFILVSKALETVTETYNTR